MLVAGVFFVLSFATIVALLWSGIVLFRNQEDPLGDRLEQLQAHAVVSTERTSLRRRRGGFLNGLQFLVSLVPGGEGWLRSSEKESSRPESATRTRWPSTPWDTCCSCSPP